jgi:hypothetical protein
VTDFPWESTVASNFARKCEALAVSGFVDYGDEIDIIAPADILKQIFKMPYSKARLSIAVHRIGDTLVLNTGYCSYCCRFSLPLFNAFAYICCLQLSFCYLISFSLQKLEQSILFFLKALRNFVPLSDLEEIINSCRK